MKFLWSRCQRMMRGAVVGAVGIALVAPGAFAQLKPAAKTNKDGLALNPNQVRGDEITPAQEAAVAKGLAWLASAPRSSFAIQQYLKITPSLSRLNYAECIFLSGNGKVGRVVRRYLKKDAIIRTALVRLAG